MNPIIIGGVHFSYHEKNHLRSDEGNRLLGQIDFTQSTITTEKKIADETRRKVILHEVLHGIFEQAGLREEEAIKNAGEEVLIDILAYGFLNVLRTNPDLIRFLQETTEGVQ